MESREVRLPPPVRRSAATLKRAEQCIRCFIDAKPVPQMKQADRALARLTGKVLG
jgi:hypothetical protein